MYGRSVIVLLLGLVIGAITTTNLKSPCPDLFHYDKTDGPGEWSGTITLLSDTELHGVWVRLIFNKELKELTIDDNSYEAVVWNNSREVLIKNRDVLLPAFTPTNIKITVKYSDDKMPELVDYRLNARVVCSKSNSIHFNGDQSSSEFIKNLLAHKKPNKYTEFEHCGTIREESKQWPWQVSIYHNNNNGGNATYLCQGSLISSKHILTTAHCVNYNHNDIGLPPKHLIIHRKPTNQQLHVGNVQIYPGYNWTRLLNDLAVITLTSPINIDDNTRPICLTNDKDTDKDGIVIQDESYANIKMLHEDECSDKADFDGLIADNAICATYASENPICIGDSGSGFVSQREQSPSVWELRGIVTFSAALQNICDTSTRILLIDIGKYLKWIQSVVVVG